MTRVNRIWKQRRLVSSRAFLAAMGSTAIGRGIRLDHVPDSDNFRPRDPHARQRLFLTPTFELTFPDRFGVHLYTRQP